MSRHGAQEAVLGHDAQERIAKAHILIVGVGALGSVAAELLCRAGVQQLTLCDYDIVQESNLSRQSLYTTADIGMLKVDAAKEHIIAIDPLCLVTTIPQPFSKATDFNKIDLIIDGTDSLATRLLQNDAAIKHDIPLVIGAASETTGIVFVVRNNSACWQCVTVGKLPLDDCESGVLGMTTHAVASMQATAALRTILGDPPAELIEIDVWNQTLRRVKVERNNLCAACKGDYRYLSAPFSIAFCQSRKKLQARPSMPRLLDIEKIKETEHTEQIFASAVLIRLGNGTVLVHKHGTLEFDNVDPAAAQEFAKKILHHQ